MKQDSKTLSYIKRKVSRTQESATPYMVRGITMVLPVATSETMVTAGSKLASRTSIQLLLGMKIRLTQNKIDRSSVKPIPLLKFYISL